MNTKQLQKLILDGCENHAREQLLAIAERSKLAQIEREKKAYGNPKSFKMNQRTFRSKKVFVNIYSK